MMMLLLTRSDLLRLSAVAVSTLPPLPASAGPPMLRTKYTEDQDVQWGPFKGLSDAEIDVLERKSMESQAGVLLSSGVRVIDLVVGDGRQPARGDTVWVSYKVWRGGFRDGPVADWTYFDRKPYAWSLGSPTDRIPLRVDASIAGMREGGWRRIVVPAAYAEVGGLRKSNPIKGGGRYTPAKAGFAILPQDTAYFDLIMVDGGSGRCEGNVQMPLCLPE